jgi:hypothetical protein
MARFIMSGFGLGDAGFRGVICPGALAGRPAWRVASPGCRKRGGAEARLPGGQACE